LIPKKKRGLDNLITLYLHPVWESALTTKEKDAYTNHLQTIDCQKRVFFASPIRMNKKKNGGFIATVFIVNATENLVETRTMRVEVFDIEGSVVAAHNFTENLIIPGQCSLPWSFVFPAHCIHANLSSAHSVEITLQ